MTVETPATPAAEPQAPVTPVVPPATPTPAPATPETPPAPKAEEKTFTQAELDAILKDRLDRDRKARETQAQKERDDAEQKRLQEQGEFQKIAENEKARADKAEAELQQVRFDALRAKVAVDHKLPPEWAARLIGEDEAALAEDAKALAKTLVPQTPVPGASPSPKPSGPVGAMTDDEARARHGRGLYSW